jgi:AcrR family transcriptional regulator
MAAADRVFRTKGIDTTTVTDITEEADVAYGSFYNHFKTMDDIVAAIAEGTIKRAADKTGEIREYAETVELLPSIGARVVMRMLSQDPAVRWLLDRPNIFVDEFYKMAREFMYDAEQAAVLDGRLKPAGGHDSWLRIIPWVMVSELKAAVETENHAEHEEIFARVSMRFMGIPDDKVEALLDRSMELCRKHGLPAIKVSSRKR